MERRPGGAEEVLRPRRRDLPHGGRRRLVRAARERLPARRTRTGAASTATSRRRPTSWTSGSTRASRTWPCCARASGPSSSRPAGQPPADVYVEGHDQHRGWFQSSLLTSVALYGDAPYRRRHHARLLPRRTGPQDVQVARQRRRAAGAHQHVRRRHRAPLGRRASTTATTMPISEEILARCAEAYRKIRNTARYLISNLYDFDPAEDAVSAAELAAPRPLGPGRDRAPSPGASARPTSRYEFHVVYHQLVNFCATTLSAFYLRHREGPPLRLRGGLPRAPLGADGPVPDRAGRSRRASAPVLPFTAEEIWAGAAGKEGRIGPPRAFRDAGRPWRRTVDAAGILGTSDQAARRGRRDARRSPPRKSDRLLPRGRHRPDRPPAELAADRAATGTAGTGPGRPLHRLGDRRGGRSARRRRLARVAGLSRVAARVPQGARPPLRPLLEGHARGGGATGLCDRCRGVRRQAAAA